MKIGILQGVLKNTENFPYKGWKSDLQDIENKKFDFCDWIICEDPISTAHNPIFDFSGLRNTFKESKLDIPIRSIYCKCFDEYNLLDSDSVVILQKRVNIIESILLAARKQNISKVIIPLNSKYNSLEDTQIGNAVFILKMAIRTFFNKSIQIYIEPTIDPIRMLELLCKLDDEKFNLSLRATDLIKMDYSLLYSLKKYLKNVTLDDSKVDVKRLLNYLSDIEYNGDFLITSCHNMDRNIGFLKKWFKEEESYI